VTHYFLDSSALVKRYVIEQGTAWVRSIVTLQAGNTILIAQITRAEVVSSASRRKRNGQIPARTAHAIRLVIDRHVTQEFRMVQQTEQVLQRAEDVLEGHALRAYDAIQLASALDSNNQLVAAGLPPLIFVSADKRLLEVAAAEGLTTDDPNDHP
jgi:hypothetical protein